MSPAIVLYAAILLAAILALWAAYRILGTPSRLAPPDYTFVLEDVARSTARAAAQLRAAIDGPLDSPALEDVATQTRKIFQTGYYQTLRLRPRAGPDQAVRIRETLGQACEAYDWASRMIASESRANPFVLEAARHLIDAGDAALRQAGAAITSLRPDESGPPSAPAPPRAP